MEFVLVSGRPGLDFLGTLKWRRTGRPEEQLDTPARLGEWALAGGLVDEAFPASPGDLSTALRLREAAYRTVTAVLGSSRSGAAQLDPEDVAELNTHAGRRPITARLSPDGTVRRLGSTDQLLAVLAVDTLDLLAGPALERVAECSNEDCTRLFVDTSRAGNRRWCGMSECGNRAKVNAFRLRHPAP
jgi:predicted RNA-binding Zn ribbon-like protein